ncbi:MAG TPA: hypothetical protein VGP62_27975 [Bryobacteraceae bacterium]|nr:hypothetical protein [Bryobacteraceae bacterium]
MRFFLLLALSASLFAQAVPPGPGFIPFAGASSGVGDDGPAVHATLGYPEALTLDAQGNLYIADFAFARVRKVTPAGTITTVAGNGVDGFSGDGGLAASAQLSSPTGVATDSSGNLYIADGPNARIRRVSPKGVITTFAGTGDSTILSPWQIAIDSKGNLYAADGDQTNVRKIDANGKITPVAGNGRMGFSGDGGEATMAMIVAIGVAVDGAGDLLIAGGGKIRKVTPDGIISTLADGTGASNQFTGGMLSIASDGTIYMADTANERVLKFSSDGTGMEVVAGTGVIGFSDGCMQPGTPRAVDSQLFNPQSVVVSASGTVYIADSGNERVRKVTPDGLIATVAGPNLGFSGDGGAALSAGLSSPQQIAVDSAGAIYIADSQNNRIRKITPDGVIQTIAGDGGPTSADDPACFAPNAAFLRTPSGVAVDHNGTVFIADTGNNRIREITAGGKVSTIAGTGQAGYAGDGGPAAAATLNAPTSLAVDAAGNLFVSDSGNYVVREITPDGKIESLNPNQAGGVAVDADGNFYVGGPLFVYRKSPNGDVQVVAGTGDFQSSIVPGGPFNGPADLGFAGSIAIAPDGTLAIGDTEANRVQRVSASCAVDDPAMAIPGGVAYDAEGNLYVSEGEGSAVWMLPAGAVPPPQGPAPVLGDVGIFNAASFEVVPPGLGEPPGPTRREPIAAGEILVLHGICMGPASVLTGHFDSNGVLSGSLGATEVTFDDVPAPLLFVQSGQIELVAPYEIANKSVTSMRVTNQGHSTTLQVDVIDGRAGIFTVDGLQAAAANSDGTLNSAANPAARGELIALYATGLGQTKPPGVDGKIVKGLAATVAPVAASIGGQSAKVVFAGDAPGFVGLSQINVMVPQGITPGLSVQVSLTVAGNLSAQMVTIAVK